MQVRGVGSAKRCEIPGFRDSFLVATLAGSRHVGALAITSRSSLCFGRSVLSPVTGGKVVMANNSLSQQIFFRKSTYV